MHSKLTNGTVTGGNLNLKASVRARALRTAVVIASVFYSGETGTGSSGMPMGGRQRQQSRSFAESLKKRVQKQDPERGLQNG